MHLSKHSMCNFFLLGLNTPHSHAQAFALPAAPSSRAGHTARTGTPAARSGAGWGCSADGLTATASGWRWRGKGICGELWRSALLGAAALVAGWER